MIGAVLSVALDEVGFMFLDQYIFHRTIYDLNGKPLHAALISWGFCLFVSSFFLSAFHCHLRTFMMSTGAHLCILFLPLPQQSLLILLGPQCHLTPHSLGCIHTIQQPHKQAFSGNVSCVSSFVTVLLQLSRWCQGYSAGDTDKGEGPGDVGGAKGNTEKKILKAILV